MKHTSRKLIETNRSYSLKPIMLKKFKKTQSIVCSFLTVLIMLWLTGCSSIPGSEVSEQVVPIIAEREMHQVPSQ